MRKVEEKANSLFANPSFPTSLPLFLSVWGSWSKLSQPCISLTALLLTGLGTASLRLNQIPNIQNHSDYPVFLILELNSHKSQTWNSCRKPSLSIYNPFCVFLHSLFLLYLFAQWAHWRARGVPQSGRSSLCSQASSRWAWLVNTRGTFSLLNKVAIQYAVPIF